MSKGKFKFTPPTKPAEPTVYTKVDFEAAAKAEAEVTSTGKFKAAEGMAKESEQWVKVGVAEGLVEAAALARACAEGYRRDNMHIEAAAATAVAVLIDRRIAETGAQVTTCRDPGK